MTSIDAVVGSVLLLVLSIGSYAVGTAFGLGVWGSIAVLACTVAVIGLSFFVLSGMLGDTVENIRAFHLRRYLRRVDIPVATDSNFLYMTPESARHLRRLREGLGKPMGTAAWVALWRSQHVASERTDVVRTAFLGSNLRELPCDEAVTLGLALAPVLADLDWADGKRLVALVERASATHPASSIAYLLQGDAISNLRLLDSGVALEYVLAV